MPENNTPSSCLPQEPLMKFDNAGQAPIIKYNLPETHSFVANVYLPILSGIDNVNKFQTDYKDAPSSNYYTAVAASNATPQVLAANIANVFVGAVSNNLTVSTNESINTSIVPLVSLDQALVSNLTESNPNTNALVQNVKIAGIETIHIAEVAKTAMPILERNLAGQDVLRFVPKPSSCRPQITMVEHYRTNTFLGNYGVGRTVKAFSLLPGEKSTISIKTFKSLLSVKKDAQNVLDSFTEESAKDFESLAEQETSANTKKEEKKDSQIGGGVNFSIPGVPIGGNVNTDHKSSVNSMREESVKALNRTISKQTQKSVANRKIEVNTESTTTETSSTEESTTRVIENLNKSRTLNFVFRQLNQELITIIYLDDVTFVFSNGYEEKKITCKIDGLYQMLTEVLTPADVNTTYQEIINQLGNVYDFENHKRSFLVKYQDVIHDFYTAEAGTSWNVPPNTPVPGVPPSIPTPPGVPPPAIINNRINFKKNPSLESTYTTDDGKQFTVRGIIKNVTHRVLPTDSLIVDALLGGGEALDCFNQKLQDAAAISASLENQEKEQAIAIINSITTPADKAANYKKVFGTCCDVAQSGCGCNCNNGGTNG
jgi:hypothetical protein